MLPASVKYEANCFLRRCFLVQSKVLADLLLLVCVSLTTIGQPRNSAPICRAQPRQGAIQFREGTGPDNVRHRPGPATRTQTSVCKSLPPSAGTAVSLLRAKTAQQRPPPPREVETWLPDCGWWKHFRENDSSGIIDLCPGYGWPQTAHTAASAKINKVKDFALILQSLSLTQ